MEVSVSSPISFISSSSQPASNRLISVPALKLSVVILYHTSTTKFAFLGSSSQRHIVFNTEGKLRFEEGQYIGVTPPGALHASYYSLASSARGDFGDRKTASLCVLRVADGVASNYLCDLKPGDAIQIIGPYGTDMLMPQDEKATVIWLATSTGIASFRGYLWKMFKEKHDNYKFKGLSWLFFEAEKSGNLLYQNEMGKIREDFPKQHRLDYAISEEQQNENGDKMYIQTRMAQYGEELWKLIKDDNTFVYMSGLASMEPGIDDFMTKLAKLHGHDWKHYKRDLKQEGRWNVEVY